MSRLPGTAGLWNSREQVGIGGPVALGLAVMLVGFWAVGPHRGEWVDIDRVGPLPQRFQLDANTADWPEWTLLPGIGETLAKRIVESRAQAGPFQRPEELLRVPGVGPRTLDRLRPHLLPLTEKRPAIPSG